VRKKNVPLCAAGRLRAEFEKVAQEALAGDVTAIQQFAGASQAFIASAQQVGASPGLAEATNRVADVAAQLKDQAAQGSDSRRA
jgi:hypothetical protein